MQKSVLIIGGASVDTIIHLDRLPSPQAQTIWPRESYRAVGSTGAGKALNLAALDIDVNLHTLLGRDHEGQWVRDALTQPHLTLLTEETDAPTEQHVNLMDPMGQRISLFTQPPVEPVSMDWHPVKQAMTTSRLAVINILGYARPAIGIARDQGIPIWTDLHDYDGRNPHHQPFLDAAEVVFLSSDNLPDYRNFMEDQIRRGKRRVVCTHGRHGASLLNDSGAWLEQPALDVTSVRDTNGAGDAFFSGFLFGTLQGFGDRDCLRLGAACGALCVAARSLAAPDLNRDALLRRAGFDPG